MNATRTFPATVNVRLLCHLPAIAIPLACFMAVGTLWAVSAPLPDFHSFGPAKPFQEPRDELWSRQTLMDKSDETGEAEVGANAKGPLDAALDDARKNPDKPIMSGGVPVAADGLLFYRNYAGINSIYLNEVRDKDGKVEYKAGDMHWRSTPLDGALGNIFESAANVTPLTTYWIPQYKNAGWSSILFENSTVGALTNDDRMVYAIDDLVLPIPPQLLPPSMVSQNASHVPET